MRNVKINGFTLVELLIALVIVAIGALGHAKMQMNSMRNAQRASFSQSANIALHDIVQRVRGMPNAALAGEFNSAIGTGPSSSESCNDSGVDCTRSEFATFELVDWYSEVSKILPSPQFSVVQSTNLFTVTLIWDANRDNSVVTNCTTIASAATGGNGDQCGEVNLWIR